MATINVRHLASRLSAYKSSVNAHNDKWATAHKEAIDNMLEALPHGSGLDEGVKLDWDNSTGEKLIFTFGFHHMDENGYYDGWTNHKLIITPSLQHGFIMRITGRNRNQIKDYLHDLFYGNVFVISLI